MQRVILSGDAVAVGFGETPIPAPGEIRPATLCAVWADAEDDATQFRAVRAGDRMRLAQAEGA